MDGCSAPLVVKFADTQREKEQKKIHQMQSSILSITGAANGINAGCGAGGIGAGGNGAGSLLGSLGAGTVGTAGSGSLLSGAGAGAGGVSLGMATSPTSSMITNPPPQANPFIGADAISPSSLQLLQQLQAVGMQQHLMQGECNF